jgi:hypothetical protein
MLLRKRRNRAFTESYNLLSTAFVNALFSFRVGETIFRYANLLFALSQRVGGTRLKNDNVVML